MHKVCHILAAEEDPNHPAHLKDATQLPVMTFKAQGCPELGQQLQSETSPRLVPKHCATELTAVMVLHPYTAFILL